MRLIYPVVGRVSSVFGDPRAGGRAHAGTDFAAPTGTEIRAAAAGRVFKAGWISNGAGNGVAIEHGGGLKTFYYHMSRVMARVGQYVAQGEVIGLVGATGDATGPHLHLEVHVNNSPVDPLTVLQSGGASPASVSLQSNQGLLVALLFIVLLSRI